jgi:hypothetical protein
MNFIKRMLILLALLAAGWGQAQSSKLPTNSAAANRILMVDSSSMLLTLGKATLTIGPLRLTNGVYTGNYKVKVFPYFLKNDRGRLAIIASDESIAQINVGKITEISATAISSKDGRSRPIATTVTPADINHGTLKVYFTVGDRKMIFEPAYHFVGKATAVGLRPANINTNLAPPRFLVVIQKP